MSDKFTYNSFGKDDGASEVEQIRQQVIKQEVTRLIRERERERVRLMMEEAQNDKEPFKLTEDHKKAGLYVFIGLVYLGLVVIGYLILSSIYSGLTKLL